MRTLAPSVGLASELDPVSRLVLEFEEAWRSGPPPLDRFRDRLGGEEAPFGLAELVKADLQNRFRRGERPEAREYLDRFPELAEGGRALSLIYEEFCLRSESGAGADASEFCRRYPTWRDSLASQLAYHRDLSRAVEPAGEAPAFPAVGDRFVGYDLVDLLGKGSSAHVYLARSPALGGKPFALKVGPDRGGEPAIIGRLDHPNIVPVTTMVVDPETGLRGLCMPYRPGLALDELIRRLRRDGLPPDADGLRSMVDVESGRGEETPPGWADFPSAGTYADAIAWVGLKVAHALAHAHARGVYHRDVKPENVLLNGRDGPQLIDFNLAHDPDSADSARAAHRGGTLPYMAREQLEAFLDPALWGAVDGRSDLFSLGLVLRELLTLAPSPRPSDHLPLPRAVSAMIRARETPGPPIRRFNRRVPHALAAIVAKCLAAAPADRYPSATALAEDLGRYLALRPLRHARNPSPIERVANAARRHRARAAVAGLLVAVVIPCAVLLTLPKGGRGFAPTEATLGVLDLAVADEAAGRPAEADRKIARAATRADAIRSFEAAVLRYPGSAALKMGLASAYVREKYLDDAARTYAAILDRDPGRTPALVGLANVERLQNHHARAADLFGRCIAQAERLRPGPVRDALPRYRVNRAWELILLGDEANDAGNFAASPPYFLAALGELDRLDPPRSGGNSDADIAFDREFEAATARLGLGRAALGAGRPHEALAVLRVAAEHAARARRLRPTSHAGLDASIAKETRRAILASGLASILFRH